MIRVMWYALRGARYAVRDVRYELREPCNPNLAPRTAQPATRDAYRE
jgi:hypothetical protein